MGEDTDPNHLPLPSEELTVHFSAAAFRENREEDQGGVRLGSAWSEILAREIPQQWLPPVAVCRDGRSVRRKATVKQIWTKQLRVLPCQEGLRFRADK